MDKYNRHADSVKQYAKNILNFESLYDDSMGGVFLEKLVSEYVTMGGEKLIEMFNEVINKQVKQVESYGDMDYTVTKLPVKGGKVNKLYKKLNMDVKTTFSAIQCIFECSGDAFIYLTQTDDFKFKTKIKYWIYSCPSEKIRHINIKKLMNYADARDGNYVVSFISEKYKDEDDTYNRFELGNDYRIIENYPKYKRLFEHLKGIVYQLNEI